MKWLSVSILMLGVTESGQSRENGMGQKGVSEGERPGGNGARPVC